MTSYATSDADREHLFRAHKPALWVRGRAPPLCEKWSSSVGMLGLGTHSRFVSSRPHLGPPLSKTSWVPCLRRQERWVLLHVPFLHSSKLRTRVFLCHMGIETPLPGNSKLPLMTWTVLNPVINITKLESHSDSHSTRPFSPLPVESLPSLNAVHPGDAHPPASGPLHRPSPCQRCSPPPRRISNATPGDSGWCSRCGDLAASGMGKGAAVQ